MGDTLFGIAAIITALGAQVATLIVVLRNGRDTRTGNRVGTDTYEEVKRINGESISEGVHESTGLANASESRRIDRIDESNRTASEQHHLDMQPLPVRPNLRKPITVRARRSKK